MFYKKNLSIKQKFAISRIFCCIIVVLIICTILVIYNKQTDTPRYIESKYQTLSSSNDIIMTVNLDKINKNKVLEYQIQNNSDEEIVYGSTFCLEQCMDGMWYIVPLKVHCDNLAWTAIAYPVKPNSSFSNKINVEPFVLNRNGRYRLVKEYFIGGVGAANNREYLFSFVEFNLK